MKKLTNDNCRFIYIDGLPHSINGFVRENDGYYTIVLNPSKSYYVQIQTVRHETDHIIQDDFSEYTADEVEQKRKF